MSIASLIENNDPDPLLREIDYQCSQRNWQSVVEIATLCIRATERGKTLWGVAEHAHYRLALEAPGEFAALAISTETGPMALGPLPEVAASTHEWHELGPYLADGPLKGATAYECVALGEDLSADTDLAHHIESFELPLRLCLWEPEYCRAEYLEDELNAPPPIVPVIAQRQLIAGSQVEEFDETRALETWRALTSTWTDQSNGTAKITATFGSPDAAILHIDESETAIQEIAATDAIRLMSWAAANGGAHGRRRGLAFGRRQSWLVLAEACGLLDDGELPSPTNLGDAIESLDWFTWGETSFEGWQLRLAVHDPEDNISFAISAFDSAG